VLGGGGLAGTFNEGNIAFADGDFGSADNVGSDPSQAVALPSTAVGKVVRNGIVYVRPRNTVASAQTYYADNITIPLTKPGMSILGCGANAVRPFMGVAIKASTVTSPVITVQGSDAHIEGMRLAGTGQTAGYAIVYAHASLTSNGPVGLHIVNCRLDNAKTGGAITLDSPNHTEIVGCSFDECAIGVISILSYGGVASRGLKIMDCDFGGRIATRTVDIYLSQSGTGSGAGVAGYEIRGCRFLDLGTLAGAYSPRMIYIVNGDIGLISDCVFSTAVAGTFGATGDQCIFPATWHIVNCHHEGVVANPHLGLIGIT
jgi:hypothetical protein